jgi:hypothetical protein
MFSANTKLNSVSKDQSEAGNRLDLTGTFSLFQNQLLKMSPSLHTEAALQVWLEDPKHKQRQQRCG